MMETSQRYQSRLIGLTLGAILALLIWPTTRWLVRSQFVLSIPTSASLAPWSIGEIETTPLAWEYAQQHSRETARRNPGDFLQQYAAALTVPSVDGKLSTDIKIQRLRELTVRFSNRPTLYAAILRLATQHQVKVERDEESLVTGDPVIHNYASAIAPRNTPEHLAAFDRDAAAGELLDPDNAYFPLMRSVGLFAAHRDAEALAALRRAAQAPAWTEYLSDEVEGEWKVQQATFGTVSALPRMVHAAGVVFPHYAALRSASRVAIAKAIEAEQAGRLDAGLAVRDEVRRCGSLMRVHSTCLIGALIGISFCQVSMTRPGGVPLITPDPHAAATEQLRAQHLQDYEAYLRRTGHAAQIAAVDAEATVGSEARRIARAGAPLSPFNDVPNLVIAWIVDMVLLSSAMWMLMLGGGSALLARHGVIRMGQGLPPATRPGGALGLLAAVLSVGIGNLQHGDLASHLCLSGVLLSGVLVLALPCAQRSDRFRRMCAFCLGFAGAAVFCVAFAWQRGGSIGPVAQVFTVFSGGEGGSGGPTGAQISTLAVAIAGAIPLVTLLTLCVLSLLWRVPLSVGVVRGLRGCAIPIACVLLLTYGVLVPITLRQENALNEGMKHTVNDEVHLIAALAGKQWPGTTY